jgi:hypothetical protein
VLQASAVLKLNNYVNSLLTGPTGPSLPPGHGHTNDSVQPWLKNLFVNLIELGVCSAVSSTIRACHGGIAEKRTSKSLKLFVVSPHSMDSLCQVSVPMRVDIECPSLFVGKLPIWAIVSPCVAHIGVCNTPNHNGSPHCSRGWTIRSWMCPFPRWPKSRLTTYDNQID